MLEISVSPTLLYTLFFELGRNLLMVHVVRIYDCMVIQTYQNLKISLDYDESASNIR